MARFREQLDEIIKTFSSSSSDKSHAYPALLELTAANGDSSSIQSLGDSANVLVSLIVIDVFYDEEEIAAQALKCLGFLIYHPSIVPRIKGDNAVLIIDSLVKVITTTKIKSVCNLGVWCISIQQFGVEILDAHFHSLLKAIVHALDNPMGSFSITFEAMQAVLKLVTLSGEKMREMSNAWAPPIYRRLVSVHNREREMTQRCLLKIRFLICPAPVTLSKTLILDLRKNLLATMKDLLICGMKIQTMNAWGWFISLLGPYAIKSKRFMNEMLKIPEQTFSDFDPQVQIAALVSWEAVIDAFVLLPVQVSGMDVVPKLDKQHMEDSAGDNQQTEGESFLKKIKLIMTPLVGVMSSKSHISVHVACLKTWSYLLHKLDTSISRDFVIKSVWKPILVVIFQVRPDNQSVWLWNICLDLLDAFISAKTEHKNDDPYNRETTNFFEKTSVIGPLESSKCSWKHYAIKCSSWDLNQLDFFIRMINSVINQASNAAVSQEFRCLAHNAALKLFRSLLRSVQGVVKSTAISYDEIMLCMNSIFRFLKKVCEKLTSEDGIFFSLPDASLQILAVVAEEIEPFILESPLYKMALDLKCLDELEPVDKIRSSSPKGLWLISYMDTVSPIVYLIVLYFYASMKLTSEAAYLDSVKGRMYRDIKFYICSYDAVEILNVFVGLLFKYVGLDCLSIWKTLASCFKDYIDDDTHPSPFMGSKNSSYSTVLHLLSYPFAICSFPHRQQNLLLQGVLEVWKLLYASINHDKHVECCPIGNFSEDLSSILNECLSHIPITSGSETELQNRGKNQQDTDMLLFIGNIGVYVLEQSTSRMRSRQSKMSDGNCWTSINFQSSMEFSSSFLKLAFAEEETVALQIRSLTLRIFATWICFISSLHLKGDILSFIEVTARPLLEWLSLEEIKEQDIACQLQLLWTEILNSLRRSRPPITFDSSFLNLQASLLEKTLDHQNFTISANTINFWNSTYGAQMRLEYPDNLLSVLDKLSRNGKMQLNINGKSCYRITSPIAPQEHRVYATLNRCSKRVDLGGDGSSHLQEKKEVHLSSKRKQPELTEHQKEVRRAQQGRSRDCNGHGPGIRTYTSVDFSQVDEESQESQVVRDADSILEMLTRVP